MSRRQLLSAGVLAAALLSPVSLAATASADPGCTDAQLIMARGTDFDDGLFFAAPDAIPDYNVGEPLYAALREAAPERSWSQYNVAYPADLIGARGVPIGNQDLVAHLRTQAAACPDQVFVLAGYSQGANVVGNSIGMDSSSATVGGPVAVTIPAELSARISAVLFFGSPLRTRDQAVPEPYTARFHDYCAPGDPVCNGMTAPGTDFEAHTNYQHFMPEAARFVVARL
ncbi:cutinase family protein [Nocardia goodfellowii]|uniref:Cutinase n=1 Tax=Nocardia goodfellowii TaxID=882446 RepID=A0ABS4QEY7_9NOCA|nr:cutinase family protein [Nocardia goodfellowii]MBP2190247.1 cutinase [Nocardia goodfellowii]